MMRCAVARLGILIVAPIVQAAIIPQPTASPCSRLLVSRLRFQRVSNGVAEVKDATLAALPLVAAHHIGLHPDAIGNQLLQQLAISRSSASRCVSISSKITDYESPRTSSPQTARAILALRQRCQHVRIDQHRQRLMKRAHQILAALRFTPVLPPMAESTCATNVVGTCTTGMPRMNTDARNPPTSPTTPPPRATRTDWRSAPRAIKLRQPASPVLPALGPFAVRHQDYLDFATRFAEGLLQRPCPMLANWRRRQREDTSIRRNEIAQHRSRRTQQPALDHDFIRLRWSIYAYAIQVRFPLRSTDASIADEMSRPPAAPKATPRANRASIQLPCSPAISAPASIAFIAAAAINSDIATRRELRSNSPAAAPIYMPRQRAHTTIGTPEIQNERSGR